MLTGKTRYRLNWRRKIILQVEHWRLGVWLNFHTEWRDATFGDVLALERGDISKEPPPLARTPTAHHWRPDQWICQPPRRQPTQPPSNTQVPPVRSQPAPPSGLKSKHVRGG